MGLIHKMSENIKKGIRTWLNIVPASPYNIQINETLDFEAEAIKNRIWYRGDGNELEQLYHSLTEYSDKYKFWTSRCTPGMEMRKIHTGLPGLIVRTLVSIVLADMNDFEFKEEKNKDIWKEIEKDNKFRKKLEKCLREVLVIGDGAFKITIDTKVSEYPIIEWYSGERIELIREHDRIKEIMFKTPYEISNNKYTLCEYYGHGYIRNELYKEDKRVDIKILDGIPEAWKFEDDLMLAVPLSIFENNKFEGRGGSIFAGKLDSFDAFDEAWSQWMDALRAGRARTYVPEAYIPRDPKTGEMLKPNPFDNRFIAGDNNMAENGKNAITTEQPDIPHDSYMASYITALDLCLQGIISPSTLGIDVKKLDNAEAQREKEKTTLYSRDAIIEALQETLPELLSASINAFHTLAKEPLEKIEVDIPFGEYANPSFESQVETVGKGRTQGIMSIEACVEELYGDSKDDAWKTDEIARLKAEQGIAEIGEPAVNIDAVLQEQAQGTSDGMHNGEGIQDAGKRNEQDIQNGPDRVSGVVKNSK